VKGIWALGALLLAAELGVMLVAMCEWLPKLT
jgi:hypothetical protein